MSRGRRFGAPFSRARLARARLDADFHKQLPLVVDNRAAHHRCGGAGPDQRSVGRHPVTVQRGNVSEGFDEVGLAGPVGSDKQVRTRLELHDNLWITPEVDEFEPAHKHQVSA